MKNIINRKSNIIKIQGGFPSLSATFILNQIIGLIDRGFNIHNWATYDTKQSVIHKQIKEYGLLETVTYLQFPHPHLKTNTSAWLSEFCRMNKVPDLQHIDAFHVHYGAIFNQLEPLFRIYQGFVMVSFHGYDASRYFVEHGDNCYNYLFQRADVITTVTHAMKHELVIRGCNPDKIRVHRSGLNPALFRKGSKNTDKVVLLTVARLEEKKGIKYSIEAFANCKNKQNAEYRIIGEGSLRRELEALINKLGVSDKVLLLGAKDKDGVITEMSHADIFVLTCVTAANGDREGLPGVLMEAHASSLPVISTYHAGIPELVENGKTGFLVQERDIEATTQAMELLISDKALRNQLSSISLDRVKYEFDIERLNDKLAQVIQDGILSTTEHVLFRQLSNINWQHKLSLYQPIFEKAEQLKEINNPKLSVIVISWRLHQDNLINFQILEQQRNHNFELIFVDNGAAEGEFDCLKPYIDTYVKLNTNTGAYLARNVGAAFAKAPILLFLEDDGIPECNLIEAHLKAHQTYDVIAVRGVYHPKTNNPLNQIARHYYHGPKPFPLAGDLEGNSSYLAETFFKVGGWDDEINFGHGGLELAIQLSKYESDLRKQIYSPDPVIYHDYVQDEQHLLTKRSRQEVSWNRLKTKYPDWDARLAQWHPLRYRNDQLLVRQDATQTDSKTLNLYAGDLPVKPEYDGWLGLSLTQQNDRHILHDITKPLPFADNSVDSFLAEDVFQQIPYDKLPAVINEIYRILKPGGLFRLSVPDYGCDVLQNRSVKDAMGNIVFDPGGDGTFDDPGHVWFPRVNTVYQLLEKTHFHTNGTMEFLHYWNMDGKSFVTKQINYSKGHIKRTPDNDERVKLPYRPMSIVVDMYKTKGL